jgi:hypothetical protein
MAYRVSRARFAGQGRESPGGGRVTPFSYTPEGVGAGVATCVVGALTFTVAVSKAAKLANPPPLLLSFTLVRFGVTGGQQRRGS